MTNAELNILESLYLCKAPFILETTFFFGVYLQANNAKYLSFITKKSVTQLNIYLHILILEQRKMCITTMADRHIYYEDKARVIRAVWGPSTTECPSTEQAE